MNYKIILLIFLMIGLYSCGVKKEKIFGTYKTEKRNVRQMMLELNSDYSYSLLLEASMTYDSIYGKYEVIENDIILYSNRKEDILHKVFSDTVRVNIVSHRKIEILNQELKKQ